MSPSRLQRPTARAVALPLRHVASAELVGGAAALPGLGGLTLVPEGQPFVIVLAIMLAAWLFGRAAAMSASAVGIVAGAWLLGHGGDHAVRAMLALLPLPMIALGVTGSLEAWKRVFLLMDVADARRAADSEAAGAPPLCTPAKGRKAFGNHELGGRGPLLKRQRGNGSCHLLPDPGRGRSRMPRARY